LDQNFDEILSIFLFFDKKMTKIDVVFTKRVRKPWDFEKYTKSTKNYNFYDFLHVYNLYRPFGTKTQLKCFRPFSENTKIVKKRQKIDVF
jgi:hypothetical protein